MKLKVISPYWSDEKDGVSYAKTNNPRVLAVIEQDTDVTFERCLEGDAIPPTYLVDRGRVSHVGGYNDTEELANRIIEAYDRFKYAAGYRYTGISLDTILKADYMFERWLWAFHRTTSNHGNYGYNGEYEVLVMNTPEYRAHIGIEDSTKEQAIELVREMTDTISSIAWGDVYGIGWATYPYDDLDEDQEIDIAEWDVDIQCWGYIGEEYAQKSASEWEAGEPEVSEILELPEPKIVIESKTAEQVARETLDKIATERIIYTDFLSYMVSAIEADRAKRPPIVINIA